MPLKTMVEHDPFEAAAASASVKVQPDEAVTEPDVTGLLEALAAGTEPTDFPAALDTGTELTSSLEALTGAAREDDSLPL
jgi:hypothetical protein